MSRAGAEPRLWRKQRNGKAYGCWWVTVKKVDVNLNTQNAEIARGRLPEAMKGKRKGWPSDVELAARAMEAPPPVAQPAEAPAPGPGAPSSSAGAPAAPAAASGVAPDAVIPPAAPTVAPEAPRPALPPLPSGGSAEQEARAEAEATNAAAAETAGNAANDNAGQAAPEGSPFAMGADAIRGMLGQAAQAIVEVQLGLQAWLVYKRTGKIAPPIDPNSPIRGWAADAWVAQFEKWFPDMGDVPPLVFALGLPAMALPAQFMGAQPPPPNQQQNGPGAQEEPPTPPTEQAAA